RVEDVEPLVFPDAGKPFAVGRAGNLSAERHFFVRSLNSLAIFGLGGQGDLHTPRRMVDDQAVLPVSQRHDRPGVAEPLRPAAIPEGAAVAHVDAGEAAEAARGPPD